ncbi:MAG: carbamoyltransferase HypF, partial [Thermodesulfobacteria bacterium]|nr:carbamoyltransferase HypF [Thermodesulfobacteriota bacterium]
MAQTHRGLGLRVRGVVQGVGFRPFVFRLAQRLGLKGYVRNTGEGVYIAIYGPEEDLESFQKGLREEAPPLARIEEIERTPLDDPPPPLFTVLESEKSGRATRIPPDVATCKACLKEIFDPENRRYRYPFTNCTDCGPRFTVIEDLPYDREKTTMRKFEMCPACLAEYTDPLNRRFHAEPNACPACGPQIWVTDPRGEPVETKDPLRFVIKALKEGKIVALKGLGGFHLACDATNQEAVRRLRARKRRPEKPLAVMVPSLKEAERLATLSAREKGILLSRESPILLARQRSPSLLAASVAPGLNVIGLMLPYTPLHHLLLREGNFLALVMTSGNLSGKPLCWQNEQALRELNRLADFFLLHDRDIVVGIDDSVVRVVGERRLFIRRARGYVPSPLPFPGEQKIWASGSHLKNTFTLTKEGEAQVSQHLGDLEDLAISDFAAVVYRHLSRLLEFEPEALACDLHPGYLSTSLSEKEARRRKIPLVKVQHHVAHAAAVAGEYGLNPPFLGLILDGLGLGPDQTLWGGELLLITEEGFERLGHLLPVWQPGGDTAARRPWRMFLSYYFASFGPQSLEEALTFLPPSFAEEARLVWQMMARKINCPVTTSLGR